MSSNYDALAKRYAKEALTTLKPGHFKVTFDRRQRVAVVVYVLPYAKDKSATAEVFDAMFEARDRLRDKWIHHVGSERVARARGPRAHVDVFAAGPSHKELISQVYEKALKKALGATQAK